MEENVPIASLTTMRLGGAARFMVTVERPEEVKEAFEFAKERSLPVWIMGSGANTIGHDEGFPGVIILNQLKGIEILAEKSNGVTLRAMGGEIWDELVEFATERGYSGIEAMSKIPGTVGAAPVQNIGAYGQDIAQVIECVEAYDTRTGEFVTLEKPEMRMKYRHTRFNQGEDAGRFFITAIVIRLKWGELKPPFYNSLQKYIDEHQVTDFSPKSIRRMVSEIRAQKLPDPKKIASAGSFFKNVMLDAEAADEAEAKGIPIWRNLDGSGKVNSGWLIEQCGLKGAEIAGMYVSDKAALVLINKAAKSYADLDRARTEIRTAVEKKFGYRLEQEPVEIPVE